MQLKKNVGFLDQLVRAILIVDLIVPCLLGFVTGFLAYIVITLAFALAISCVTGYCWLYGVIHFSTRQPT
ncbi:hypothetical protein BN8_04659 [Fibrisoma limi BUZ 3]|uniref:Inner membrane protein YgaP-like transmembrane domain-containing protein n=1 Tax=Fibrisoma limi BUZ 3 TaxID=1185876 RepID=I2GNC5_9BACT|nr:YgaP-like transmembrane domain [Fibrisoma limi]CCH55403.1 hypothetical protein BN8_04659 [Fibrisoma limi BUZ 3]